MEGGKFIIDKQLSRSLWTVLSCQEKLCWGYPRWSAWIPATLAMVLTSSPFVSSRWGYLLGSWWSIPNLGCQGFYLARRRFYFFSSSRRWGFIHFPWQPPCMLPAGVMLPPAGSNYFLQGFLYQMLYLPFCVPGLPTLLPWPINLKAVSGFWACSLWGSCLPRRGLLLFRASTPALFSPPFSGFWLATPAFPLPMSKKWTSNHADITIPP